MDALFCLPCPSRTDTREDQDWITAVRAGAPWALERFYYGYQSQVFALCYRIVGRSEDAEDAMQGTFVRAFRQARRFRGDSSLKTWLYRIAVNEALAILRKRRDVPPLHEQAVPVGDGAPGVVERLAVRSALAQLSPQHRAILVLRFWEGLNGPEIARILGISVPA